MRKEPKLCPFCGGPPTICHDKSGIIRCKCLICGATLTWDKEALECAEDMQANKVLRKALGKYIPEVREELKPCPFCGYQPELISVYDNGRNVYVWCWHCGCQSSTEATDERAIAVWNRRVTP